MLKLTCLLTGFHEKNRVVTQLITNTSNNNSRLSHQGTPVQVNGGESSRYSGRGRGRGVLGSKSVATTTTTPEEPKVGKAANFDSKCF